MSSPLRAVAILGKPLNAHGVHAALPDQRARIGGLDVQRSLKGRLRFRIQLFDFISHGLELLEESRLPQKEIQNLFPLANVRPALQPITRLLIDLQRESHFAQRIIGQTHDDIQQRRRTGSQIEVGLGLQISSDRDRLIAKLKIAGIERVEIGPRLRNHIEPGDEVTLRIKHTVDDHQRAGAPCRFLSRQFIVHQSAGRVGIAVA